MDRKRIGKTANGKKEEEPLQSKRYEGHKPEANANLETQTNSLKRGGQPLSQSGGAFFESRFGFDFCRMRIHSGSQAAEVAGSLNASH